MDGFIFHNNFKERNSLQAKIKGLKEDPNRDPTRVSVKCKKDYYSFDEALKTECIVLAKFNNGSCQMMTPI